MAKQIDYTNEDPIATILEDAIVSGASDVHFDAERGAFNVRYRIDGTLYQIQSFPSTVQQELVSRIKVLGEMDITESRLPRDGHFEFPISQDIYNIRVSTMPTPYGEAVALRILNRGKLSLDLDDFGNSNNYLTDGIIIPRKGVGEIKKLAENHPEQTLNFSVDESFVYVNAGDEYFVLNLGTVALVINALLRQ